MKSNGTPLSMKKRKKQQKSEVKTLLFSLLFLVSITMLLGYKEINILKNKYIYDNLNIYFASETSIEYGTGNYNPISLVQELDGGATIINRTETVDTNMVGTQELMFKIEKENIVKEVTVELNVVDTQKPIIELKKDSVSIYKGNDYNLLENISKVYDLVDGDLTFKNSDEIDFFENKKGFYSIITDLNKNELGTYEVRVIAVDCNNNYEEKTFEINVINKPVKTYKTNNSYRRTFNVDTSSVVNAAYSLLGARYVYAGKNPNTGFDCSGFVKYVYSLFGVNLGSTVATQRYQGYAVSRSEMAPGDIIIWSTNGVTGTHSALYVGNGQMIHAANPSQGVILSDVSHWENYGGGSILSIRRV